MARWIGRHEQQPSTLPLLQQHCERRQTLTLDREVVLHVALPQASEGWPPYEMEEILAIPAGTGEYAIVRPPAFAFGLAVGDRVTARWVDGVLWLADVVAFSGHSTVRVVVIGAQGDEGDIRRLAASNGAMVFDTSIDGFLALDMPPEADFSSLIGALTSRREQGQCDFSIGVVADGHTMG